MTNVKFGWKNLALYFAALCLGVSALMAQPQHRGGQGPGAQGPQGPPQRDPLAGVKHALTEASAPALSTQQEQQLTQLLEAARANRPEGPIVAWERQLAAQCLALFGVGVLLLLLWK